MPSERTALAGLSSSARLCNFGRFSLDVPARMLRRDGMELPLRQQTWKLLCVFAANPRRLCTKSELMSAVWLRTVVVDDSLVQCIVELRRALGDDDRRLLRTVPRLGYRFDADPETRCDGRPLSHRTGESTPDGALKLAWHDLGQAGDALEVEGARHLFEAQAGETGLRSEALAGVAMAHVIDVLNRWARCAAWSIGVAREAAEESMTMEPRSARAFHAGAHVAMLEGRHVEAYLGFQAALKRDPTMARARLRMGVIEMEMGHPERTEDHVQQALRSASEDDEVLLCQASFIQGMALFHLGRDNDAARCMQRVLALRPGSGLASQWLASIDALGGRLGSSEGHLAAFCQRVPGHSIASLRATERSTDPRFVLQRNRFYDGLKRAGLS